jgi:hypothetical protein
MAIEQEFEDPTGTDNGDAVDSVSDEGKQGQPVTNLDDLPQFRKFKSEMDKKIASISNETNAERNARLALEDELKRIRMSGMDEPERIAYERDEAIRMNQNLLKEVKRRDMMEQKRKDLQHIARKVGVSYDELSDLILDSDTVHEAWDKAHDLKATKTKARANDDEDEEPRSRASSQPAQQARTMRAADNPANFVDTGNRGGTNANSRYQKMYDKAFEENDAMGMLDAMAAADQAGVRLKRDR